MYTTLFRDCFHLNYSIISRSSLMHGDQLQQCKCLDCGMEFSQVERLEVISCKSKQA